MKYYAIEAALAHMMLHGPKINGEAKVFCVPKCTELFLKIYCR